MALSSSSTGNETLAVSSISTNYSSPELSSSDGSSETSAASVFKDNKFLATEAQVIKRKSSSWKLFDPLVDSVNDDTEKIASENCKNALTHREKVIIDDANCDIDSRNELLNKNLSNLPGGKTLISFESPKKPLVPKYLLPNSTEPFKKYTEDEFRQILKTRELSLRTEFTNKYNEYIMRLAEMDPEQERELHRLLKLNKTYHAISSEFVQILNCMSKEQENMEEKLKTLSVEDNQLTTNIKTTKECVSGVESSFSDFHKRYYGQCKSMVKTLKENELLLLKNIEMIQGSIDEQSRLNSMLEARTRDILEKATEEVQSAKKSSETQVTVLKARLKKSEMKICSLERDFEQAKLDNHKLGSISDDLMSKISG